MRHEQSAETFRRAAYAAWVEAQRAVCAQDRPTTHSVTALRLAETQLTLAERALASAYTADQHIADYAA